MCIIGCVCVCVGGGGRGGDGADDGRHGACMGLLAVFTTY